MLQMNKVAVLEKFMECKGLHTDGNLWQVWRMDLSQAPIMGQAFHKVAE